MLKKYKVDMPINNYNIELMRFSGYGQAYLDYRIHYENEYQIGRINTVVWENNKAEVMSMAIEIELVRR